MEEVLIFFHEYNIIFLKQERQHLDDDPAILTQYQHSSVHPLPVSTGYACVRQSRLVLWAFLVFLVRWWRCWWRCSRSTCTDVFHITAVVLHPVNKILIALRQIIRSFRDCNCWDCEKQGGGDGKKELHCNFQSIRVESVLSTQGLDTARLCSTVGMYHATVWYGAGRWHVSKKNDQVSDRQISTTLCGHRTAHPTLP